MPWTVGGDLPEAVQKLNSQEKEQWVATANALLEEGRPEGEDIAIALEEVQPGEQGEKSKMKEKLADKVVEKISSLLDKAIGEVESDKTVLEGGDYNHEGVECFKSISNEELQQALYVVYEPYVLDAHNEWMAEEDVRKACHNYNKHCRKANLFHMSQTEDVEVLESYILPTNAYVDDEFVQKGTWLACVEYKNDELWKMAKEGEVQGLSLGGMCLRKSEGEPIHKSFSMVNKNKVAKGELEKYPQITDVSFETEGSHLAVCHRDQGFSANNRPKPLVMKSTKGITDEMVRKAEDIQITMSMADFLVTFFDMWYDDAEVLATALGYPLEDTNSGKSYEEWIQERASAFEVINKDNIEKGLEYISPEQKLELLKFQEKAEPVVQSLMEKGKGNMPVEKGNEENSVQETVQQLQERLQKEAEQSELLKQRLDERDRKDYESLAKSYSFVGEEEREDVVKALMKARNEDYFSTILNTLEKAQSAIDEFATKSEGSPAEEQESGNEKSQDLVRGALQKRGLVNKTQE